MADTPPDNLPFGPTNQSFENNLGCCPLIPVTIIAGTEVNLAEALSATSVFTLAESKVKQAQAFRRISVNPTTLLSQ